MGAEYKERKQRKTKISMHVITVTQKQGGYVSGKRQRELECKEQFFTELSPLSLRGEHARKTKEYRTGAARHALQHATLKPSFH